MTSILESAGSLITRILATISVSSWLPAGTLVMAFVLLEDMSDGTKSGVADAVRNMTHYSWGRVAVIVVLIAGVASLLQPFHYSMIRILEGYWGPMMLAAWSRADFLRPRRWAEQVQWRRYRRLQSQIGDVPSDRSTELEVFAETRFPSSPERMMPTALGNTLRSAEDAASSEGKPIQSEILVHFDELPLALQQQHDLFRNRLDVFAQLVFVWLIVGTTAAVRLPPSQALTILFCFVACLFSYKACIASAEGYGETLRAIRVAIDAAVPAQQKFELKAVS